VSLSGKVRENKLKDPEAGLLIKSSSFRCYQIYNCQTCDFGHTLLCCL